MMPRYHPLATCSLLPAAATAAWLARALPQAADYPAFWIVALCAMCE